MANRMGKSGSSVYWTPKVSECSLEINRHLLLERKVMTNLDNILKSRDITLLTKVHIVKPMIFPAVTYKHDNWTIKKAECQKTDAFQLWWWKRPFWISWTARRANQSILKKFNHEYSSEGVVLNVKFNSIGQYIGHLMQRVDSLEKTLMLGKI